MNSSIRNNTTLLFYPKGDPRLRLFALWYFTILISIWWIAGILVLGFEQSWLQFIVSAVIGVSLQFVFMWVHIKSHNLRAPWEGGFKNLINFLVPAYPPSIAIVMLLYPNERIWPIIFAVVLAIGSKALFRAPVGNGTQHYFNPSNFGITLTLFLFPSVGLAPPYHFTENVSGIWDWVIPIVLLIAGIIVHEISTARFPMIVAWLGGFIAQAVLRSFWFGTPLLAALAPLTSVGFALFTLYMIPDPGTSPIDKKAQIYFGLGVACVYALVQINHILFGLVLSLTIVCGLRGLWMHGQAFYLRPGRAK
tara:strand:+ start:4714 stop:5634 length:921 start_codon:yes stop_codon:yes gene_type:complete